MTRLPRLKGKELVRLLERFGFEIVRREGAMSSFVTRTAE
jgi:predicted RNA binding protein YcfA (HicA-like mRNA interferase family)